MFDKKSIKYFIDEEHILVNLDTGKFYDREGKELETFPDTDGYLCLRFRNTKLFASKVAAYAYFGEIALINGLVVSFKNHDRRDVRRKNLQVMTRGELQKKPKWHDDMDFMIYDEEDNEIVAAFKDEKVARRFAASFKKQFISIRWRS